VRVALTRGNTRGQLCPPRPRAMVGSGSQRGPPGPPPTGPLKTPLVALPLIVPRVARSKLRGVRPVRAVRSYKDAAGRRRGGYRVFHDVRHGALTNDAAAGMSPVKLKTKAGHSSFSTTEKYVHLAGQHFPEEAELGARRLLGALSTEPSTDLSASQRITDDATARSEADSDAADVR
jgi:hypothetical protein